MVFIIIITIIENCIIINGSVNHDYRNTNDDKSDNDNNNHLLLLLFVVVAVAVAAVVAVGGKKFSHSIYNNSRSTALAAVMFN